MLGFFAKVCVTICVLYCTLTTPTASAITITSVSGLGNDAFTIGPSTGFDAFAVSFSLDQRYEDIVFSADTVCVLCTGTFLVQANQFGAAAVASDTVFTRDVLGSSTPGFDLTTGLKEIFTLPYLDAGIYFATYAVTSGTGGWGAAGPIPAPTISKVVDGAFDGQIYVEQGDLQADIISSDFLLLLNSDIKARFEITGNVPTAVSEPNIFWLMAIFVGLTLINLQRKNLTSRPGGF